jgi:hypothetical protein
MSVFIPFMSESDVVAIGRGLLDCTLPKADWTHAAHFAAALWLIERDEGSRIAAAIRAYNESVGTPNTDSSGYHETITQASMRVARVFRAARKDLPLYRVCNELMMSEPRRSDWLLRYWSREVLFSVEARRRWVEPDLRPLELKA